MCRNILVPLDGSTFGEYALSLTFTIKTHGRGGLTRLLLGSVTDKVIRGEHVPVLVTRPSTVEAIDPTSRRNS